MSWEIHERYKQTIASKETNIFATRTIYSQSCIMSMWCMQKVQWRSLKMPKLADWPNEIISKVAPFIYTGLDSVAPFYIKYNKEKKFWVCIFTCSCSAFGNCWNTPNTIILGSTFQFKLTNTTVDKAWYQSITRENMQKFERRWNQVEIYCWVFPMYGRLGW